MVIYEFQKILLADRDRVHYILFYCVFLSALIAVSLCAVTMRCTFGIATTQIKFHGRWTGRFNINDKISVAPIRDTTSGAAGVSAQEEAGSTARVTRSKWTKAEGTKAEWTRPQVARAAEGKKREER